MDIEVFITSVLSSSLSWVYL